MNLLVLGGICFILSILLKIVSKLMWVTETTVGGIRDVVTTTTNATTSKKHKVSKILNQLGTISLLASIFILLYLLFLTKGILRDKLSSIRTIQSDNSISISSSEELP